RTPGTNASEAPPDLLYQARQPTHLAGLPIRDGACFEVAKPQSYQYAGTSGTHLQTRVIPLPPSIAEIAHEAEMGREGQCWRWTLPDHVPRSVVAKQSARWHCRRRL